MWPQTTTEHWPRSACIALSLRTSNWGRVTYVDAGAQDPMAAGLREVMLAEYKALRDEQLQRMNNRITLVVASLTVSGTLIGVGLERASAPLMLFVPVIASLFGLLHVYHHVAIKEIGAYIRAFIERPLLAVYPEHTAWHHALPPKRERARRIAWIWHLPIMLVTLVPSAIALILPWGFHLDWSLVGPLLFIDVVVTLGFAYAYIREVFRPVEETVGGVTMTTRTAHESERGKTDP